MIKVKRYHWADNIVDDQAYGILKGKKIIRIEPQRREEIDWIVIYEDKETT